LWYAEVIEECAILPEGIIIGFVIKRLLDSSGKKE
jgi:hypothetical protein